MRKGLFFKDFTFMSENQPFLENGYLNVELIKLIGNLIEEYTEKYRTEYKIQVDENILRYLTNIYVIDDEEILYKVYK